MSSWNADFSHIYFESTVEDSSLAKSLRTKFPDATWIPVPDYREIFNRPRQRFQHQKGSMKLILAQKKDSLLYRGSDNAQDFGVSHFYYVTPVLNCLYNCDYCFLQGMYQSANLVVFANQEAMISKMRDTARVLEGSAEQMMTAISYNTDLLAMEPWLGLCRHWIEANRSLSNSTIEIRTKSGNFRSLRSLEPAQNAVLAWTVSPPAVFRKYESRTAPPAIRIRAAAEAAHRGWPVRICLDPVLKIPNWEKIYTTFIDELFTTIPPDGIRDLSLGVFRMSSHYFKTIRARRPTSDLYYYPFQARDGLTKYPDSDQEEMMERLTAHLSQYLTPEKMEAWSSSEKSSG